jgi:hypothetical protein
VVAEEQSSRLEQTSEGRLEARDVLGDVTVSVRKRKGRKRD